MEDDKNSKEENSEDDLTNYLKEVESLKEDFSDLYDLDLEELKDIQEAIEMVKKSEEISDEKSITEESEPVTEDIDETEQYLRMREQFISDFSDLDELDLDELREIQEAIKEVKEKESKGEVGEDDISTEISSKISVELEERIKQELKEREEERKKAIITPDKFIAHAKDKRDKIWYHALYYLVNNAEDNVASKEILYEMLKEVTSKSPIDPIPQHQFYFGLGYLLRLTLNEKQLIRYIRGGKFKLNVNPDLIKDLLEQIGPPISRRPHIDEEEKKKMFKEFLKDDFLDI